MVCDPQNGWETMVASEVIIVLHVDFKKDEKGERRRGISRKTFSIEKKESKKTIPQNYFNPIFCIRLFSASLYLMEMEKWSKQMN